MKFEGPPPIPPEEKFPEPPLDDEEGFFNKEKGEKQGEKIEKTESALQEREITSPEKLSQKEASKKLLEEERKELAEKIYKERKENKDRISELKVRLELLKMNLSSAETNWELNQKKYQELSQFRAEQANSFTGRIKQVLNKIGLEFESDKELQKSIQETETVIKSTSEEKEALKDEIDSLENLLESDSSLENIKNQLSEHYAKTEQISKERFEQQQKSVENSIIRNDVFILHTLTTHKTLRHNVNSPVSNKASLEDDLDIMFSLEPSLSTSSVGQGKRKELFQENFGNLGIVIGGGEIHSANLCDVGTVPSGIGERGRDKTSLGEIDKVLNDKEGGYNEIVIDNPKIFGMFKSVDVEKDGSVVVSKSDSINAFKNHVDLAHKKGIPQFVLTPDRKMFEYISVDESGKIQIGKEISPEDVAKGNAGLSREDRKKLGEDVISRYLFRDVANQREAKNIVAGLAGENIEGKVEISNEEYIEQLKKYPDEIGTRLSKYPKSLLSDKSFMLEVAQINPEAVMAAANQGGARELVTDPEFIKSLYSLIPAGKKDINILSWVPKENITKELVLVALEHGDDLGAGVLKEELFNDPEIKDKLIQSLVDKINISLFDREDIAYGCPNLTYSDSAGRLKFCEINEDQNFLQKIREKYKGVYKIDPYYDNLLITKVKPEG